MHNSCHVFHIDPLQKKQKTSINSNYLCGPILHIYWNKVFIWHLSVPRYRHYECQNLLAIFDCSCFPNSVLWPYLGSVQLSSEWKRSHCCHDYYCVGCLQIVAASFVCFFPQKLERGWWLCIYRPVRWIRWTSQLNHPITSWHLNIVKRKKNLTVKLSSYFDYLDSTWH